MLFPIEPDGALISDVAAIRGDDTQFARHRIRPLHNDRMPSTASKPTFREAFRFWLKLGFISFGGPTGQIAIMHRELVEEKKWIDEGRFVHALNYCMLLPGPEAQQLATYIGWLLHRTIGGVVAGVLFVLPSAVILWGLSWLYVTCGEQPWVIGILAGLKPAVVAIVLGAVGRIGTRILKNPVMWVIAAAALLAIAVFKIPFPVIVFGAGLVGFVGGRWRPERFAVLKGHPGEDVGLVAGSSPAPNLWRSLRVLVICAVIWWAPVALFAATLGSHHTLTQQGIFFGKAAMVTFGGAYAVLPYVSQQAVERFGWLSAGQMLDGLGLAETTPGPLIMVLQFVGFLGAWNSAAPLSPLLSATLGAAITTWTTFAPSFLYILVGAPYIERLRANIRLTAALSAITAAVVGVILNLALWFGGETLFAHGHLNVFGVIVIMVALALMQWRKWDVIPVVGLASVAGLLAHALGWV